MNGVLSSISIGGGSEALFFLWDGFTLKAALFKRVKKSLEVAAQSETRTLDLSAAIGELLEDLKRKTGRTMPRRASLVAANTVAAVIDLPVDPDKPRPKAQMQELIRWELEPLFAQRNEAWTIGSVLQGRGYLTADQRRDVAVDLELAASGGRDRRAMRFGELAIEREFITTQQLDESLRQRETLVLIDDEILSGWQGQQFEEVPGERQTGWLTCGMGQDARQRLQRAFHDNGVRLDWIYPLWGHSYALLPDEEGGSYPVVVIEVHQDQVCCLSGMIGALASLRTEALRERPLTADVLIEISQDLLIEERAEVYLSGTSPDLAEELGERLQRPVHYLPDRTSGLAGPAAHRLGLAPPAVLARLDGGQQAPPIWKNGDVMRIAAAVGAVLVVAGIELGYQSRISGMSLEVISLRSEFDERQSINEKMRDLTNEVTKLSKAVDRRRAEVAAAVEELALVEGILTRRRASIPGLLKAIEDSVNDEVALDAINESADAPGYFTLTAWALTDTSAQLFVNRLDRTLEQWDLTVTEQKLRRARGRFELDGYTIDMRLIPRPPQELDVADDPSGSPQSTN